MKRLLLFCGLLGWMAGLFGQDNIPTREDIAQFMKSTTYVVLEDNPISEFNVVLKQVMPEEWSITPFKFITYSQFEKMRIHKGISFIVTTEVKFDKDRTNATYKFMSLVLGGPYSLTTMPDLCSIPLSYFGIGDEDYSYKLGIFVRFMQNRAKLLENDPSIAKENIFKYYNKNIKELKGKTLYLVADEMAKNVNTAAKIRKVYPGPFKLVSKDDIQKAIADRKDIVFLHKVGPENSNEKARVYKILIGADDAQFYYFSYHMMNKKNPDGFLASDFKRLAKKL